MKTFCLILAAAAAFAQDPPPTSQAPVLNASVSGIVRDRNTGQPLANYSVSTYVGATWIANAIIMPANSHEVKATTDDTGRYKLSDLPAAPYQIDARSSRGGNQTVTKSVVLSGHDIELNFDVVAPATVKGKIVDENKEPLPNINVMLVAREYFLGSIGYYWRTFGTVTNDRGEFTVPEVPAGESLYLLAEQKNIRLGAHSDAPLIPKLRRRVAMRTWYPNSPSPEGAAPLVLRPGEVREAVNIEMKKSPNFCAEGTLLTATGGPGALRFQIAPMQPSSGVNPRGGSFSATGNGVTGADGAFRICDLYPGNYRIEASQTKGDFLFGAASLNIVDQDIKGLKIAALPTQPLAGEVVLDGPVPADPLATKINVYLSPMFRTQMPGERAGANRIQIPGAFTIPGVTPDDYAIRSLVVNGPGLYLKDVQLNGISVMNQPIHLANNSGSGLRIVIGQDGATFTAQVTSKDGNPAPDLRVVAFSANAVTEAALADAMIKGQTNQMGQYKSHPIAPGHYFIGAVDAPIDTSYETIGKIWRSKSRFTEIDIPPNGTPQINLEPITLAP